MYHTPEGDRVLRGAEKRLFIHSLAMIVDEVKDGEAEFGYEVFDGLQPSQKLAVLHRAGRALLCTEEPMPELTAVLEGTVATVYQYIRCMVLMEIEAPGMEGVSPSFRSLVRDAAIEAAITDQPPDPRCSDADEWDLLIECLEDLVLWDDDFLDQHNMDADPETSHLVKEFLGIDGDYYTEVAPDPVGAELDSCVVGLRQLTMEAQ